MQFLWLFVSTYPVQQSHRRPRIQVLDQQHIRFGLVRVSTGDVQKDCLEAMRLLLNTDVQAYLSTLRLLAKLPSVYRLMSSIDSTEHTSGI